jgi:hypothetical protein
MDQLEKIVDNFYIAHKTIKEEMKKNNARSRDPDNAAYNLELSAKAHNLLKFRGARSNQPCHYEYLKFSFNQANPKIGNLIKEARSTYILGLIGRIVAAAKKYKTLHDVLIDTEALASFTAMEYGHWSTGGICIDWGVQKLLESVDAAEKRFASAAAAGAAAKLAAAKGAGPAAGPAAPNWWQGLAYNFKTAGGKLRNENVQILRNNVLQQIVSGWNGATSGQALWNHVKNQPVKVNGVSGKLTNRIPNSEKIVKNYYNYVMGN